ncbi:hypothetical protein EML15_00165 [Corynebacterium sp. sy017]|uniref:hypothetical protein n=1 Tax=unclassified Corynebacterium TaxID=2624378 RepID=UPI001186062B|nr:MULTISPECIES: hypothetical protein [unclassified Corynebacterium]MBP3087569.1 hypothetical protein [Corynebacterium sp. sy017]QDZ42571.1 hypothetical protein FQV43_04895 [Corynebacterium sp. sy039]TSD92145.1 hypothetical protein ELY17_00165 [Corynebacterium sp. SY003]
MDFLLQVQEFVEGPIKDLLVKLNLGSLFNLNLPAVPAPAPAPVADNASSGEVAVSGNNLNFGSSFGDITFAPSQGDSSTEFLTKGDTTSGDTEFLTKGDTSTATEFLTRGHSLDADVDADVDTGDKTTNTEFLTKGDTTSGDVSALNSTKGDTAVDLKGADTIQPETTVTGITEPKTDVTGIAQPDTDVTGITEPKTDVTGADIHDLLGIPGLPSLPGSGE